MRGPTGQKELPTDKARQGKRGQPVLVVLVAALLLAAVAWAVAEFYGQQEITEPGEPTPQTQTQPGG